MYEKFPIAFDTITLQTKETLKFGGNSMNAFEKETLLYSDIKAIRESVEITRCVA